MSEPHEVGAAVARNVRALRTRRGWTLDTLSGRSGVSKGMLAQIEQGRTNPSIATLCRIATALGVPVPRLVELAELPAVRVVAGGDAARLWSTPAGSAARLLAGTEGPVIAELWEWRIAPGDGYDGEAHPAGTRELLHVLEGTLTLLVDRARHAVPEGDTALFRADRPHRYANEDVVPVRFVMVVLEDAPRG